MKNDRKLVVLDFDGFAINSYQLMKLTFAQFGLNIGDEERFRHRRKFLKYMGGGKEFLRNLVLYSLPKKKKIRNILTEIYLEEGRIFEEFVPVINNMIADPMVQVGILSRNYTHNPGTTIRTVLRNSNIDEAALDFVIPVPAGVKKDLVLEGMKSSRFKECLFGGDEVADYNAAKEAGYGSIVMASYGFDNRKRLLSVGRIPEDIIFDTPKHIAMKLSGLVNKGR